MIISLGIFGKIWGIAGMFLSVPILVVMLIIFSNFNQTNKTEKEVITPLNTFLLYQKINFLPNQDKSDIELARRPDEQRSKILPSKLNNKSLDKKSIHWQSADLIYADQSEIKIKNPDLQIVGLSDINFLQGNPQDKLFISNNDVRHTNDPLVNFSINSGLALNNEAIYSRPHLNRRSPINEIKTKKWSKEEFASPTDVSLKNSERIQKAPSSLSIALGDLEKKKFDRLMANFQISLQLPLYPFQQGLIIEILT